MENQLYLMAALRQSLRSSRIQVARVHQGALENPTHHYLLQGKGDKFYTVRCPRQIVDFHHPAMFQYRTIVAVGVVLLDTPYFATLYSMICM